MSYSTSQTVKDLFASEHRQVAKLNMKGATATIESAPIAHITDAFYAPLADLKVGVNPVQSGSGDPSPNNIRPISGHTEANVPRCGFNVWDEVWDVGTINSNTGQDATGNNVRSINYISVVGGTTYYANTSTSAIRIFTYRADKSYIGYIQVQNNTFTLDSDVAYIRFRTFNAYGSTYNNDISINYPSTDTAYHQYNGNTYNIPFGQTVYGGTLNVTTGLLTVDYVMDTLTGDSDITGNGVLSYGGIQILYTPSQSKKYAPSSATRNSGLTSNLFATAPNKSSVEGYVNGREGNGNIYFNMPSTVTSVASAKTWFGNNNTQIVYELATPTTIQLTPVEVSTLFGQNNIWADTGNVELTYYSDFVLDESDIIQGSFVVDRSCASGKALELGSCIASEMSVTLLNADGSLDGYAFNGTEIFAEIGVVDDNDIPHYIPLGKFIVDGVPKVRDSVSITALDRMTKFDKVASGLASWWGEAKTVQQIISVCCSSCGVTLATNINSFPNVGYECLLPSEFIDGTAITYRQLLSYAVQLMGKNAWMNAEGLLEIGFASATPSAEIALTDENRYSSDFEDYTIEITGVICTKTEKNEDNEDYDHEYVVGTDEYAFDLSDNPLIHDDPSTALSALSGLIGLEYTPIDVVAVPCPYLFPLDWVSYEKADSTTINSIVTNFTFAMNGNNGIRSTGETPAEKERASVGNLGATIKQLIDYTDNTAEITLQQASVDTTNLITSATGGQVYFKKDADGTITEITIMDDTCYDDFISDNPQLNVGCCWRWNKNGFGYSSTGYDGTYATAITMNGMIVGDFIATGSISASKMDEAFGLTLKAYRAGIELLNGQVAILTETDKNIRTTFTFGVNGLDIRSTNDDAKIYSHIGASTYQFRRSSDSVEVFSIDEDGTTGKRADVTGQVGIGAGTVDNYTEQWAIRKGEEQFDSNNSSIGYDLQFVWIGG